MSVSRWIARRRRVRQAHLGCSSLSRVARAGAWLVRLQLRLLAAKPTLAFATFIPSRCAVGSDPLRLCAQSRSVKPHDRTDGAIPMVELCRSRSESTRSRIGVRNAAFPDFTYPSSLAARSHQPTSGCAWAHVPSRYHSPAALSRHLGVSVATFMLLLDISAQAARRSTGGQCLRPCGDSRKAGGSARHLDRVSRDRARSASGGRL